MALAQIREDLRYELKGAVEYLRAHHEGATSQILYHPSMTEEEAAQLVFLIRRDFEFHAMGVQRKPCQQIHRYVVLYKKKPEPEEEGEDDVTDTVPKIKKIRARPV